MYRLKIITSAIVLALMTTSCSEQKTAEQHLVSGNQLIESAQYDAAVVELKNAAKLSPRNVEVRTSLGRSYVSLGRYLDAEKELEKAIELGGSSDAIIVMLSFTKLKLGDADFTYDLVNKSEQISDSGYVHLLINAGIAALESGAVERGQDYLSQALTIEGKQAEKHLANAYLSFSGNDFPNALSHINKITNKDSSYFEGKLLQGKIQYQQERYIDAVEALTEYKNDKPFDVRTSLFIVKSLIAAKQYQEADLVLQSIPNIYDVSDLANLYKGQIEFEKKEYTLAKQYADAALQINSGLVRAKVLAGLSSYELGNLEQAYFFLNSINSSINPKHPIKRLLAFLKLELGYPAESADIIDEFEQLSKDDVSLIIAASVELMHQGRLDEAQSVLTVSEGIEMSDSAQKVRLALLKHASGSDQGITDLQEALKTEPRSLELNFGLVSALLTNDKSEEALEVAKSWLKVDSTNVEAILLVGKVHYIRGEKNLAEQYYNNALAIDPLNEFALLYFAQIDLDENNSKDAIQKIESLLEVSPHSENALKLYYNAHKLAGTKAKAIDKIKQGFLKHQDQIVYRVFYAKVLYADKYFKQVSELLLDADVSVEKPLFEYYQLLGDSFYRLQDLDKAEKTYIEWIAQYPKQTAPWFRQLQVLDKKNDKSALLSVTKSMIKAFPREERLKSMLPYYQILNKRFDEAEISINRLSSEHRALPFIKGLVGQIQFSRKEYVASIPNLKLQYELKPSAQNAGFLYTSYIKLEQHDKAIPFFEAHLSKHPNDVITKIFYAQYMLDHNLVLSAKLYSELLVERPQNIVFLNNAAWAEQKLGNHERALNYINKAKALAPNEPVVLDTLAVILYSMGNKAEAIEIIDQAHELAPENNDILKHRNSMRNGSFN